MLAKLPKEVAVEMMSLITHLKSSLQDTILEKFNWTKSIPYKAIGIWLCVINKMQLESAKRIYSECIAEYDSIESKSSIHRVAHLLFEHGSELRRQGEHWSNEENASLQAYPLLFEAIFYYAFILLVEVAVEGEHKKIADILSHPGRKEEAPTVCAIMRFPQNLDTARGVSFDTWAPRMFKKRDLLSSVLANIEDEPEQKRLRKAGNRAQLVERIYSAGCKEHFENIDGVREVLGKWNKAQKVLQPATIKPVGAQAELTDYVKHRLSVNTVFSLPASFFDDGGVPDGAASVGTYDDLYDTFAAHADMGDASPVVPDSNVAVFQVINAFPERRSVHHVSHLPKNDWLVHVNYFGFGRIDANSRLSFSAAQPKRQIFDLRCLTVLAGDVSFPSFLSNFTRWLDVRGAREITLPRLMRRSAPSSFDVDAEPCGV